MPLWRSQRQNVYHVCQRCGTREILGNMQWQNGILVCAFNRCVDTAVIGTRDVNVARAVAVDRKELLPDRKLIEPTDRKSDQDDILYGFIIWLILGGLLGSLMVKGLLGPTATLVINKLC